MSARLLTSLRRARAGGGPLRRAAATAAATVCLLAVGPALAQEQEDDFDEVFGEIEDEFAEGEESAEGDDDAPQAEPTNDWEAEEPAAPAAGGTGPAEPEARATRGADVANAPQPDDERLRFSGYVQPAVGVRYRPAGVPRDKWEFGADATRIGVELQGSPIDGWFYDLHVVLGGEILNPLIDVSVVDRVGNGAPDDIDATTRLIPGLEFEEAVVGYEASDAISVELGQMRIPFTVQHQSPNTSLMFPQRSGPNDVFLKGTDLGALATADFGRLKASAGVFNGTGSTPFASGAPFDPSCNCNRVVRGLMYSGRVDVSPLGEFPLGVRGRSDQPLRLGVGAGVLYFPYSTFDSSGFANSQVRDLRASASFRLAVAGLTGQVELLRRQQTDSLSFRPIIASGGYGQVSYYVPVSSGIGFAPIARWGSTVEDQSFDPRTTYWTEAGLTLYVHPESADPRDEVRMTIHYLDERRVTEGENAHGMIAQLQMLW